MNLILDSNGTFHNFSEVPKRIVSLVPSLTETLYDLGLEEHIIGITEHCKHPYHLLSTKVVVGSTKGFNSEKIKALKPDLILANALENNVEELKQLVGICPVFVTNILTVENVLSTLDAFGEIFKKKTDAKKWKDKIQFALDDFKHFVADIHVQKVAYLLWREPYIAAGKNSFINDMLQLNKFQNIYDNHSEAYPEVEIRKMRIQGDPEIVFLAKEPCDFQEEHAFEIGRVTHHAKTVFVENEFFSWYGTRLFKAFQYFKALHNRLKEDK